MSSSLVDLARESSSEKRRELLQEVSNLFVEGAEGHSDREAVLFGDVLGSLLDQVPVDDRAVVANKVAGLDCTPRDLAMKLAEDEAQVAAPVLQFSPALTEADLVDLASRKGQDHLRAIAKRSDLSATVTDVVVDRGNSDVLNVVTRNLGARFSDDGFAKLAEKVAGDHELGETLSFRSDMPPQVASTLIARLSPAARQRLEHLVLKDGDGLGAIIEEARKEVGAARQDHRRNRLEAKLMVTDVRAGRRGLDDVVDDLVMKKRMLDLALVLSELSSIPEAHANNVLHKVNSTGIAVICRTLDLSETTYGRLSQLRCARLKLNTAQVEPMLREYRSLDKATAERALRFHQVRSTVVSRAG